MAKDFGPMGVALFGGSILPLWMQLRPITYSVKIPPGLIASCRSFDQMLGRPELSKSYKVWRVALEATSRFQVPKDGLMLEADKITRRKNVGKTNWSVLRIFFVNFPKMKFAKIVALSRTEPQRNEANREKQVSGTRWSRKKAQREAVCAFNQPVGSDHW
jgi:hypothetical protein